MPKLCAYRRINKSQTGNKGPPNIPSVSSATLVNGAPFVVGCHVLVLAKASPPCGLSFHASVLVHKQVLLVLVPKPIPNVTESYHLSCSSLVSPHLDVENLFLAGDLPSSTLPPLLSTVRRAGRGGTWLWKHTLALPPQILRGFPSSS